MNYLRILRPILGHGREATSGELNFCCPFCKTRVGKEDTNYHLYINPNRTLYNITGWFYCHRCRAAGPLYKITKVDHKQTTQDPTKWQEFLSNLQSRPKKKANRVTLPKDYVEMIPATEAYEYLKNRGLSDETMKQYRIGFGTKNLTDMSQQERRQYAGSGRIIFPDYDINNQLVYWVARTYKNHKIKYKNPAGSNSRDKIYNLAQASLFSDVIITEGVMSAIAAGRNAVATYGKDVTRAQIALLCLAKFDRYYVALDGDTLKKEPNSKLKPATFRLADALYRQSKNVYVVTLPHDHDPASVENFQHYLDTAKQWDFKTSVELLFNSTERDLTCK